MPVGSEKVTCNVKLAGEGGWSEEKLPFPRAKEPSGIELATPPGSVVLTSKVVPVNVKSVAGSDTGLWNEHGVVLKQPSVDPLTSIELAWATDARNKTEAVLSPA